MLFGMQSSHGFGCTHRSMRDLCDTDTGQIWAQVAEGYLPAAFIRQLRPHSAYAGSIQKALRSGESSHHFLLVQLVVLWLE